MDSKKTILVVEDEPQLALGLRMRSSSKAFG